MTKLNKIILIVIVLLVGGVLIVASYMLLDGNKPTNTSEVDDKRQSETVENNNISKSNSEYNPYMPYGKNKSPNKIIQNTKISLNGGDKFVYEYSHVPPIYLIDGEDIYFNTPIKCVTEYNITDEMIVDKTAYFKIQENAQKCIIGAWNLNGVFKPIFRGAYTKTIYVDEDTGEIFKGVETGEKEKISNCYWSGCWYASWMLKLDDGANWKEEQAYSENERVIRNFSVEVRETIDGRECFEVKIKWNECLNDSCKITRRDLYYIDVEKRITLRYYLWYEDLPVRETRLINQNYFTRPNDTLLNYETKTNISEYNKRMRLINRIGYCEDNFCNSENNETIESCCMDCGCPEGKICNGVCMLDKGDTLEFSSEEYGFGITLPSGWRGKWRGESIFFELASEPWTSVEVFFDSSSENRPQYSYSTSDNITAGNKNFTIIYSAPTQKDYDDNLELYGEIKSSFRSG